MGEGGNTVVSFAGAAFHRAAHDRVADQVATQAGRYRYPGTITANVQGVSRIILTMETGEPCLANEALRGTPHLYG